MVMDVILSNGTSQYISMLFSQSGLANPILILGLIKMETLSILSTISLQTMARSSLPGQRLFVCLVSIQLQFTVLIGCY
jgi:hypothetical protein